jgi:hypothetical protein
VIVGQAPMRKFILVAWKIFVCLTKTIEKDKVDEFSNTKDESVKVISTGFISFDFLPKVVPSANYSLFYNFKPRMGLKLPLINCSLLI